eukprot:7508665-Alexandrium_andersonii.AAC.1
MLQAAHQQNWLSVEGDRQVILYSHGSVPGDPWADIIFGLLYSKITNDLRQAISALGAEVQITRHGQGWAPDP